MNTIISKKSNVFFDKKSFEFLTYKDYIKLIKKEHKSKINFSSQMQSYIVLKIILFSLSTKFTFCKNAFLEEKTSKNLKKTYKKFTKIFLFFEIFTSVFEENIQEKLYANLKNLKHKFEILMSKKFIIDDVISFFNDKNFENFFINLEYILNEDESFFRKNTNSNLEKIFINALKKECYLLKGQINSSNNHVDFDKINFLIKYFSKIYPKMKKFKKMLKNQNLMIKEKEEIIIKIDNIIKKISR